MKLPKNKLIFAILVLCCACLFAFFIIRQAGEARAPEFGNVCINNLRSIEYAKGQWVLEHQAKPGDVVTVNELSSFINDKRVLKCLLGGTYQIGKIGENPTCSLGTTVTPAHVLP